MMEYPFKIHRSPKSREMIALELLSAACSDDLHGTDYFETAIRQYLIKRRAKA